MCLPTSCDSSVKRLMSQICMRGLVGDSSITNRVRPGLSACLRALRRRTCTDGLYKSAVTMLLVSGPAAWVSCSCAAANQRLARAFSCSMLLHGRLSICKA